jgi:hypothetical protein
MICWRHVEWRLVGRVRPAVAMLAVCAVGAAVLDGAPAPAKGDGSVVRTTRAASDAIPGVFEAAAGTSARDVWAVGHTSVGSGQTLIAHWNGAGWSTVPSPSPGSFASLAGVAATATTDAWAVGLANASPVGSASPSQQALILRWDGVRWTQVAVPALGPLADLRAVAATSAGNAWAVGSAGSRTLILHWDGSTWTQMPGPAGELEGVAASSPSNAWAVGSTGKFRTLILHWNGRVWSRVPSPSRTPEGLADFLNSVAIGPGNAAWAVGTISCGCGSRHEPHRAVERPVVAGGPQPHGWWPGPRQRDQHRRTGRVGGGGHWQRPRTREDGDPALEWTDLEAGGQSKPGPLRVPCGADPRVTRRHMGRWRGQRPQADPVHDRRSALEREDVAMNPVRLGKDARPGGRQRVHVFRGRSEPGKDRYAHERRVID